MAAQPKIVEAADFFCGAGGTSSGLVLACQRLKLPLRLLAINHWQVAIDTHSANHPQVEHRCESLDNVDPRKAVPGGYLRLLVASPECTHHSNARGGKPMSDQSRASAWHILRWAEALYIENILIENVREFRSWGPLGKDGRPLKTKKGETYRAFLESLRSLGYLVEDKILNAADFGDPTTRERLFIIARRGGKKITWPTPTHQRPDPSALFKMKPWRPAREIIDWKILSKSIFERKRPLSKNTMARIIAGLRKFGGKEIEPFLVVLRNNQDAKSLSEPLSTVSGSGAHHALCTPFMLGQQSCGAPRSTDKPVPTIATDGAIALVGPFVMAIDHSGGNGKVMRGMGQPLSTVMTKEHLALVEPFLVSSGGPKVSARPVSRPVNAVYYGTGEGVKSIAEPLDTVTTKDRFALVTPEVNGLRLDIRFRMLQPHELARAQGFPDDYQFSGNRSQVVKQIGNSVPVNLACALCLACLT